MPSDFVFRLSTYLTLAMACVCLAFSEWDLLPEVTVVAGLVVVLLVVTFKIGPRFELSLTSANRVGLGIAVVAGGWLAYQFINRNSLIYTLPWPVSLLPYIGPLLMVLMLAKMFRPKHVGDWWAMQGMGLATVGLAAAMAETAAFGVLLAGYAVLAVWSVSSFYFRRTAGALMPVPGTDPGPAPEIVTPPGPGPRASAVWAAAGCVAGAVAVAVPLFFLTPRSGAPRWSYATGGMITGLTSDRTVDLTREGTIAESSEVAYEVRASDRSGRPFEDIGPGQRWRAVAFNQYDRGRWTRTDAGLSLANRTKVPLPRGGEAAGMPPESAPPADLGPGQITLDFLRLTGSGDPVVYDPVVWRPGQAPPLWTNTRDGPRAWWQLSDASFRPNGMGSGRNLRYAQIAAPPAEPDLGPPLELTPDPANPELNPVDPRSPLQEVRLPNLRDYAEQVVRDLVRADRLSSDILDRADTRFTLRIDPRDYEAVARAVCDHLRGPGPFKYSLTLTRVDKSSDPIEDFVLRTRAGHCQRFASALVLMLRSLGVPAVYILGYKGCDPQGDGLYLIRQESAHAWAEVLVPRFRDEPGRGQAVVWHWLSLDPTPDFGLGGTADDSGWGRTVRESAAEFFNDFILGYNPERQYRMRTAARAWVGRYALPLVVALVAVMVALGLGMRARRVRARSVGGPRATGVPWYDRFVRALDAAGFRPSAGATPREYAVAVGASLHDRPDLAAIPVAVTTAFYQTRYGGRSPTPTELSELEAAIGWLETQLRLLPPPLAE